jgi:hypothetical protein
MASAAHPRVRAGAGRPDEPLNRAGAQRVERPAFMQRVAFFCSSRMRTDRPAAGFGLTRRSGTTTDDRKKGVPLDENPGKRKGEVKGCRKRKASRSGRAATARRRQTESAVPADRSRTPVPKKRKTATIPGTITAKGLERADGGSCAGEPYRMHENRPAETC